MILPVIGGSAAPPDRWPDATAIISEGEVDCTGTLITPDLVLTAGHCAAISRVSVGTSSRSDLVSGDVIDVSARIDYDGPLDVALLRLARASTRPPRLLATGWVRFEIVDGAPVALVGFGAVDPSGTRTVDALQEAETAITDAACAHSPGCRVRGDELGAGGGGIDTCRGDSGGPLYLETEYGDFLGGVTSRAYAGATVGCSDGGIYVRADAIAAWIEDATGETLPTAPSPSAAAVGDGVWEIDPHDPHIGAAHTFAIVSGDATVDAASVVTGDGEIVVRVTDAGDPRRALDVTIPADPAPVGCDAGGGAAGTLVGLVALLSLHGRRRLDAL